MTHTDNSDVFEEAQLRGLTTKQTRALPMLATGASYQTVAAQIEVAVGTLKNWCSQNEIFRRELHRLQTDLYIESRNRLQALAYTATDALFEVLTDPTTSAKDKIGAARVVLGTVTDKRKVHSITVGKDPASMIAEILNNKESIDAEA